MPKRAAAFIRLAALAATLALSGCSRGGDGNNLAALDSQLVGNDSDPALTSALADQIAVDPALANQSNRNAVRPPETPTQAQYPVTEPAPPAGVHRASAATGAAGGCTAEANLDRNLAWANRMPVAFPVYPGAKVTEAAANDAPGCRVRIATFTSSADWQRVLDWYEGQAARNGYDGDQQVRGGDHILAGTNGDAAYYLIVTPRSGGSDVALIVNNGR